MRYPHAQLNILIAELRQIRLLLQQDRPLAAADFPEKEHAEVEWVIDHLGISLSTFRRHVKGRLLSPVMRAGKREFYSRREVIELTRRGRERFTPFRKLS